MSQEEDIVKQLTGRFPELAPKLTIARPRRIFAEVAVERFGEVFDYAVRQMDFSTLCTITGLDQGATLGAIYHVARTDGVVLSMLVSVDKSAPVLRTITPYFPAADAYEREMVDLLGMQVQGLPEGSRYPLTDDWPQDAHPLRKDWQPQQQKEAGNV